MVELIPFGFLILCILMMFINLGFYITTSNKRISKDACLFSCVYATLSVLTVIYIGIHL